MLLNSFEMIQRINDYRTKAIERKLRETEFENCPLELELDILESFEKLYQRNSTTPYYELKYSANPDDIHKTHAELSPNHPNPFITIHQQDVDKIKWFSEECFATPITNAKAKWLSNNGYSYRIFDQSIYEQELFQLFSVCKNEVAEFIYHKAVVLMALHEFAHAANSHVQLRNDRDDLPKEVLRGLEIQADIMGAIYFSQSLKDDEQYIGLLHSYPSHYKNKLITNTYFNTVILATLVAYISFRCTLRNNYYWSEESDFALDGSGSRPLTEARMKIVIDTVINTICPDLESAENRYLHRFLRAMIEQFELFYCSNTTKDNDFLDNRQPLKLIETAQGETYLRNLRNSAEIADDYLQPYKKYTFFEDESWKNHF